MHDEERHLIEYMILFLGLLVCLVLFVLFRYNQTVSLMIGFCGSLYYMTWGILHHAREGRLTRFIFMEYMLIGIFVFFLLYSAIGL